MRNANIQDEAVVTLVRDIKAMLDGAEAPATDKCCIYKTPSDIRKLNPDAYTPKVVSIGPFHHNNSCLQNMEKHKLIYFNAFLKRSQASLETWISYIQKEEPNIRSSYSETLRFSKEELVKIICVDAGFIFELFLCESSGESDTFLSKPWLTVNIKLDLLLVENQLPFFVLEGLYKLSYPSTPGVNNQKSFIELTFRYFSYNNSSELQFQSILHFTDLLRNFHLQHHSLSIRTATNASDMQLPSATELAKAGVRFKVNSRSNCFLDLKFSKGVLEILQLMVEDKTESLFRNMVALEQCLYPEGSYITDYVDILDFLINTDRDVDILVRKGVIVNWLGDSNSAAYMFNGLMKNVTQGSVSSDYSNLCQALNAFCKDPCRKMMSTLRRDYCSTPWQTAVSIAGILLLILSLVQTFCSVLQVLLQKNAS